MEFVRATQWERHDPLTDLDQRLDFIGQYGRQGLPAARLMAAFLNSNY